MDAHEQENGCAPPAPIPLGLRETVKIGPRHRCVVQTVELGPLRLHALRIHPGVPGEADRVAREIARVDPGTLLVDLDTDAALRALEAKGPAAASFRPGFVDGLYYDATRERFAKQVAREPHPLVMALRTARTHRTDFIALRTPGDEPGFFARAGARRAISRIGEDQDAEAFTRAFASTLVKRGAFDPAADVAGMMPRLENALDSGRAPFLALMQAPRADAFLQKVKKMPRRSIA